MKKKLLLKTMLSVFVFLHIGISSLFAQWTSTGPEGGEISKIVRTANALFAVTNSSPGSIYLPTDLYSSTDNGTTWTKVSGTANLSMIFDITSIGNSIFLGTALGVFRSDDNGVSWVEKTNGFPAGSHYIKHLAASGTTLFAAGTQAGLLRSLDNGESWTITTTGLDDINVYSLTANETSVFVGTGEFNLGVYRSIDNGNNWSQTSNGMGYYFDGIYYYEVKPMIYSLAFSGSDLYAGTGEGQGIWKSIDNGENWVFTSDITRNYIYYTSIHGLGNNIFAGSASEGIIKSSDNGASWTLVNSGIDVYRSVNTIASDGESVFAGTKGGIYKSNTYGSNWVKSNTGINCQQITFHCFAEVDTNIFVGTTTGGIYRSSDDGMTWTSTSANLPVNNLSLYQIGSTSNEVFAYGYVSSDNGNTWNIPNSPGTAGYENPAAWIRHNSMLFTLKSYDNAGVYRSVDGGTTWTMMNQGLLNPSVLVTINSDGSTLYLGADIGAYYSIDNGETWNVGNFPGINPWSFSGSKFAKVGNAAIYGLYGGGGQRGIYRSIDNGANWVQINDIMVHELSVDGNKIYASGTQLIGSVEVPGLFLSDDFGLTWSKIASDNFTRCLATSSPYVFISKNNVNASTGQVSSDIFVTTNDGLSWIPLNDGLEPETYVFSLNVVNNTIYASCNGRSVWQRNLTELVIPSQPSTIVGSTTPCIGSSQTYSVTNISGVNYNWQFPVGWVITSGGTTHSVTVTVGSTPGIVLVTPSNSFGTGPAQYLIVNPNSLPPDRPGPISGSTTPTEGTTQTYSVTNDPGVTYTWAFPSGWVQTGGGTTNSVTVTVGSGAGNIVVTPSTPCGTGTARTLAVTPVANSKTLTLTSIFPEGLYAGLGTLNQANDELGAHWPAGVADHITVELHDAANYATIAYSAADVPLSTSGAATVTIPSTYNGSYYITIRHRNSLQTVSATAQSFAGGTISQSFGSTADIFGGNLVQMTDLGYAIYSGDVNQDDIIDLGDSAPVDNQAAMAGSGYMPEDVNGDGLVDLSDAAIIDNNAAQAVGAVTP